MYLMLTTGMRPQSISAVASAAVTIKEALLIALNVAVVAISAALATYLEAKLIAYLTTGLR